MAIKEYNPEDKERNSLTITGNVKIGGNVYNFESYGTCQNAANIGILINDAVRIIEKAIECAGENQNG